jgi:hypothetical protein
MERAEFSRPQSTLRVCAASTPILAALSIARGRSQFACLGSMPWALVAKSARKSPILGERDNALDCPEFHCFLLMADSVEKGGD